MVRAMTERPPMNIAVGDTVRVRIDGDRRPPRFARVVDLRRESLSGGVIVVGRWQDDGSSAWIVPGQGVEVVARDAVALSS
jgi:hypothetical protein